jgi:hypothetical protein
LKTETSEEESSSTSTELAQDEIEDERLLSRGKSSFQLIGLIAILAIVAYCWQFAPLGPSPEQEKWGQFGDFLGGVLNPAIGLVTVYLVLINVRMQRKELKNSLNELRNSNSTLTKQMQAAARQDLQQTFFTWLNSYQAIVGSVSYADGHNHRSTGRDGLLSAFRRNLGEEAVARILGKNEDFVGAPYRLLRENGQASPEFSEYVRGTIMGQWEKVYSDTAHHTGSMFRTLYRLMMWIDRQDDSVIDDETKRQYISIARAQISDIELDYLFFNGLTSDGKNFAYLINKYALFDNFDEKKSYLTIFLSEHNTCPYEPSAYKSEIARSTYASTGNPKKPREACKLTNI